MIDIRLMSLDTVISRCHENTLHYLRTHELGDDRFCLELFRRAVQENDQRAWAFVYTFYSTEEFLGEHYLLKWVRSWLHGRHGAAIRSAFTEEELVQEVWFRFMRSEAARQFSFTDMRHLMAFLRRMVNNFALDVARRRVPAVVEASTSIEAADLDYLLRMVPDDKEAIDAAMASQEAIDDLLTEVVGDILTTENEWLVFRGYFLDNLPPRKLYTLHPGKFVAGEVETTRTRLARRLRKAPYLLDRYVKLVVLEDDERLSLVFEHAIVGGLPDNVLLRLYPSLFPGWDAVLAAKVQVVEALRNRPALLQLLNLQPGPVNGRPLHEW